MGIFSTMHTEGEMPLYEYHCKTCGHIFEQIRSMAQYRDPYDCPICGQAADRTVLTAPRLNDMKASVRQAHQVNERSAHEPRSSARHKCGPGCGHHHHQSPKPAGEQSGPNLKMQPGKRPWMIGH